MVQRGKEDQAQSECLYFQVPQKPTKTFQQINPFPVQGKLITQE